MTQVAHTLPTTEDQGRLPSPPTSWPISRQRFDALASTWRSCDVWLSLWTVDGEALAYDEQPKRLWTTFWSQGAAFRRPLREFALSTIQATGQTDEDALARNTVRGPWLPNIALMATPILIRTRILGVMVGAVAVSDEPSEAFSKLCDQCKLDSTAMLGMITQAGRVDERVLDQFNGLFSRAVDQARAHEVAEEEIGVLTQNLQNTYEELHLIYKISGQMGLPKKPISLLARVSQDVLEVSRAGAVAFVLRETEPDDIASAGDGNALGDRIVQVGQGAPNLVDLDRLAESLCTGGVSTPSHLLHNNATRQSELHWARPWLKHLVALPLKHEHSLLGVMLAMNCLDEGDFTSVDVQLLRAVADRVTSFLENQRLYDDLANLLMALLHALINSVDAKDPYTYGHSERVAHISRTLAQSARLSPVECDRVYLAGLLHDVGKIGVPDAILCKPGKLTKEEFDALKQHPEIGVRILSPVKQIRDLLPGVLYHHERIDGRGYPEGLAGEGIPRLGRIVCLADCFDAMTTDRTYRTAMPLPVAVAEIRRCSGTQFDPELSELFLRLDLEELMQRDRPFTGGPPSMGQLGALSWRI